MGSGLAFADTVDADIDGDDVNRTGDTGDVVLDSGEDVFLCFCCLTAFVSPTHTTLCG
jgi:hypothetical protein